MTDDWFNYSDPYSPTTADYWLDNHPKTLKQYERQEFIKGLPFIGEWYSGYLLKKDQLEQGTVKMDMYDIDFEDIKYPHSSGLLGTMNSTYVSAGWTFSKNLSHLYK